MLRPAGDGEEEPWRAVGLGVSSQRAMPERRKRNPGPPVESNNLVTASIGPDRTAAARGRRCRGCRRGGHLGRLALVLSDLFISRSSAFANTARWSCRRKPVPTRGFSSSQCITRRPTGLIPGSQVTQRASPLFSARILPLVYDPTSPTTP